MRVVKALILLGLALILLVNAAQANPFGGHTQQNPNAMQQRLMQMLPEAARNAAYSANRTMRVGDQVISGRVYHSAMNERSEMNTQGMQITSIVRMDRGIVITLLPGTRNYMEIPLDMGGAVEQQAQANVELINKGKTSIDGVSATHYHMPAWHTADGTVEADYYMTDQGVPIKSVMRINSNGREQLMHTELSNVKLGKQDPALFEVPPGYSKMSIPGGILQR